MKRSLDSKDRWTTATVKRSTLVKLKSVEMELANLGLKPTKDNILGELVELFWFVRSKPGLWDEYMASKR